MNISHMKLVRVCIRNWFGFVYETDSGLYTKLIRFAYEIDSYS